MKLIVALLVAMASAKTITPKTTKQFAETSVRIYNFEQTSGGTGSILKSLSRTSYVLTNKHVCRLVEQGGWVDYKEELYEVTHYKKFPDHDLCLVKIGKGLNVSLNVSEKLAKESDTVFVSGHPNLLPHIVTQGHLTGRMDIDLIIGLKPCDIENMTPECLWFGGEPVIQTFDSQVVSNLIKPGSSGSAVFNTNGEIIGLIYAGSGRNFSHGFIVPQIYLLMFMQKAKYYKWVEVGTEVDDKGLKGRIFNYDTCKDAFIHPYLVDDYVIDICKSIQDNMIWRE